MFSAEVQETLSEPLEYFTRWIHVEQPRRRHISMPKFEPVTRPRKPKKEIAHGAVPWVKIRGIPKTQPKWK